jgi:hypothetical protein
MNGKLVVQATVRVTIEIPVTGSWGGDMTAALIYEQAKEEALARVNNAFCGTEIKTTYFDVTTVVMKETKT